MWADKTHHNLHASKLYLHMGAGIWSQRVVIKGNNNNHGQYK